QERSLQGAEVLIEYLQNSIVDAYDSKVDILGILPFLSKRSASVDKEILDAASEEFGDENIFNAKIMQMERVKRMRSEEHTSELQSRFDLVCRLLLEKKKNTKWEH